MKVWSHSTSTKGRIVGSTARLHAMKHSRSEIRELNLVLDCNRQGHKLLDLSEELAIVCELYEES